MLEPFLRGRSTVGLANARQQLHCLEPNLAHEIDGMEAAYILRRAGFVKDYSGPDRSSLYKRAAA